MYCYAIILVTFILAVALNLIFASERNSPISDDKVEINPRKAISKAVIVQNCVITGAAKKEKENKVRFQDLETDTLEMEKLSKFKATIERDRERRDKVINWFKSKFTKKVEEPEETVTEKQHCCGCPQYSLQPESVKTSGPVQYKVTYQRKVMYWKKMIWSRPAKKQYKTFAHYSAQDRLPQVWHTSLMRFSDHHPIVYNGTLWTTTNGAQQRLVAEMKPRRGNRRGRKKNIKRTYETLDVEAIYQKYPQYRCFYSIKKETILQLNPRTRAQWRR